MLFKNKNGFVKLIIVSLALLTFFSKISLTSALINILIVIDFILIGGVLPYLERKKLSLIQKRVGPKFVGLNGRLQFIVDAMKIFFKDYFSLLKVKKFYFFLLPVIFLFYNLLFLLNFNWSGNYYLFDVELNFIYILIFSTISNILVFLTGYICKNKYTILTSSRTVSVFFINELLLTIITCQIFFFGKSFSFHYYMVHFSNYFPIFLWLPYLPVIILLFLLEVNKVPFDFQEAESELIMGYTNEYPGFLFGVYVLIEYLHIFIYSFLVTLLFF